ncbi:MAG: hypothetical protein WEB00_14920 [Dehalococcoidia bacterium]
MNQQSTGHQLPEQWQQALVAMRESIAQASAAMQLLAQAMNELRPLFESAEALQAEFSRYNLSPGAAPTASFAPIMPLRPAARAAEPIAALASPSSVIPPALSVVASNPPEFQRSKDTDLESAQKYTISFKSEGPVDLLKVHSALESVEEISGMSLADYGPNSAELEIWTTAEPGSLPIVAALQDSFDETPTVEPAPDGLIVRFGKNSGASK